MSSKIPNPVESRVRAFDQKFESVLQRLWFLGDAHGDFQHIGPALDVANQVNALPSWLVFVGDLDIDQQSLREILAPMLSQYPSLRFAFVHGNHDADSYAHWDCLHDAGEAVALHGQVVELDGIRVAGLGGNFMGRVWVPPSQASFASKAEAMKRGTHASRNGQRPNPKLNGAIYPSDVAVLAKKRADVLVTHEAPSCHPYGWAALDQLARDMGVVRGFHGHTHDDMSAEYALVREQLGFDARAVNFRSVKNGLGEAIAVPSNESRRSS